MLNIFKIKFKLDYFQFPPSTAPYFSWISTILGGPGSPMAFRGTEGLSSLLSHSDFSSPAASLLPRLLWGEKRVRIVLTGRRESSLSLPPPSHPELVCTDYRQSQITVRRAVRRINCYQISRHNTESNRENNNNNERVNNNNHSQSPASYTSRKSRRKLGGKI